MVNKETKITLKDWVEAKKETRKEKEDKKAKTKKEIEAIKAEEKRKAEIGKEIVRALANIQIESLREAKKILSDSLSLSYKRGKIEGIIPETRVPVVEKGKVTLLPKELYIQTQLEKEKAKEEILKKKVEEMEIKKTEKEYDEAMKRYRKALVFKEEYEKRGLKVPEYIESVAKEEPKKPDILISKIVDEKETLPEPIRSVPEVKTERKGISEKVKNIIYPRKTLMREIHVESEGVKATISEREGIQNIYERIDTGALVTKTITRKPSSLSGTLRLKARELKRSVPVSIARDLIPLGTPQMRKWLGKYTDVRGVSREVDWRKVELRRLKVAARR